MENQDEKEELLNLRINLKVLRIADIFLCTFWTWVCIVAAYYSIVHSLKTGDFIISTFGIFLGAGCLLFGGLMVKDTIERLKSRKGKQKN